MKPLQPEQFVKVYMLLKQTGVSLYPSGLAPSTQTMGTGMFPTLQMAEHQRLVEMLSDTTGSKYHIFELDIPNPAYEQK